jgi:uroporphyrinogen-III synthase
LFAIAPESQVQAALARTRVAAVGPIVAAALAQRAVHVASMPQDSFFMKPLTTALEAVFAARNEAR